MESPSAFKNQDRLALSTMEDLTHLQSKPSLPDESSIFSVNFKDMYETAQQLIKSALPTSVTYISEFIIGLACLRYIGQFGTAADLAGASLGFTWANVFCLGLFSSIDQGFCALASRLYGAGKHREFGILFQRNLCVLSLLAIPLIVTLLIAEGILVSLGLDPEVAASAGTYLRLAVPSLLGTYLFNAFRFYLVAQEIFDVPGIVVTASVPLHILWCYLFIEVLGMSVAGAAIAKSITDCTGALILYLYIKYSGKCQKTWIPWDQECLMHWGSYLKQTIVLGGYVYVEWISYEISVFVIGALNNKYILGAHGTALNLTIALFTIPLGNSIAMQTYIGHAVGEGSKAKVQKFVAAGLFINTIASAANVIGLLMFNREIARFFTNDPETMENLQTILFIYSLAHFADTFANHLGGVLRVLGQEHTVFGCYVLSYIGIGFNAQWIFGLVFGWGYVAIWISIGIGMYLMLGLMIMHIKKLDWVTEMMKIKAQEESSSSTDDQVYIEMKEIK